MNPFRFPHRAALALAVTVLATSALAPTLGPSSVSAQLLTSPSPSPAAAGPTATAATTPAPPTAPPASAAPSGAPTRPPRHRGGGGTPSTDAPTPTPTPTSPAFSSLDGYWEVVLQTKDNYTYSSFNLHQAGDEVTGTWNHDGKKVPLTGNYDGRQFKFVTQDPVHAQTLAGYVEGATDMVGIIDDGTTKNEPPAFTASHRESTPIVVFPKHTKT